MEAEGAVTLARFVAGSLDLDAGGDLSVREGGAGAVRLRSDGAASLMNLRLGGASVVAGGAISALAIRADWLTLDGGGDVSLGGVTTAGSLYAGSLGQVRTVADAPAELAAVSVAGVRGATVGIATDARLGEAALGRQRTPLAAGEGASLEAIATTEMIGVGGEAVFAGLEGIDVRGETVEGGTLSNRFSGETLLVTPGDARLEAAGALVFAGAEVWGDLSGRRRRGEAASPRPARCAWGALRASPRARAPRPRTAT